MNKKELLNEIKNASDYDNTNPLENAPEELRKDREFLLEVAREKPVALTFAAEEVKKDEEFINKLKEINPSAVDYLMDTRMIIYVEACIDEECEDEENCEWVNNEHITYFDKPDNIFDEDGDISSDIIDFCFNKLEKFYGCIPTLNIKLIVDDLTDNVIYPKIDGKRVVALYSYYYSFEPDFFEEEDWFDYLDEERIKIIIERNKQLESILKKIDDIDEKILKENSVDVNKLKSEFIIASIISFVEKLRKSFKLMDRKVLLATTKGLIDFDTELDKLRGYIGPVIYFISVPTFKLFEEDEIKTIDALFLRLSDEKHLCENFYAHIPYKDDSKIIVEGYSCGDYDTGYFNQGGPEEDYLSFNSYDPLNLAKSNYEKVKEILLSE